VTAITPDKVVRPAARPGQAPSWICCRAGRHDTQASIGRTARACADYLHLLRRVLSRGRLYRDDTSQRMMQRQTLIARCGPAHAARLILRSLIAAFCLGFMASGAARAQPAAFTNSNGFVTPPGWVAQAPDPEQIVLLGPDGLSLIIICLQQGSLTEFFEKLLQPIRMSQADLIPLGSPAKDDEQVSRTFISSGLGPLSRAFVAARAVPAGRLLIAYGLTQPGRETELARTTLALLDTVRLPALARPGPETRPTAPMSAEPSRQWRSGIAPAHKKAEQDQAGQATQEAPPRR